MFKRNVIKSKAMMGVGFKSEGTPTASLDHCLYRVKRTAADLRLVQSQIGAYLQHARAKGTAGRGVTASLSAFFAHAQADADAPEVLRERDTHASPDFNKARDAAQSRRREAASHGCRSPDLKSMEAAFKASSAGPPLAGVLEHIHEGIQVTVLAPIGRLVDELTVAEQRLLHVKNGALKKEHDYYSSKVKALTEGATKAETKAAELKRLAEERASAARAAAAEAAAAEKAAERQNAGGPSWLSEGKDSGKDKATHLRRPSSQASMFASVDPSKDPKVEKQRKLAAEEAERVARNQAKSEEAARFYFSALHSAMDHAETLMACAPGHVARAVAQFRGHKELAAAAEHALAVEDLEATMPEEVHWDEADFIRKLEAAERGEAVAPPSRRGGDEGGEMSDEHKKSQCHAELRAEVVLALRNRVKRQVKGIEGSVRKKGWLGSSQHRFAVLRGNCLELYHDKSRYDTGRPPEDALRVTLVEPAGETKPHYIAPPASAAAASATGGSASSSSSQDEPTRRKSEALQEPLSATSEYGFFNSELGDLLVSTSFDGASSGTSSGAPNSSSNGIGLASFKITATTEVPAFWTAEEIVTHMRAESVPSVAGLNSSSSSSGGGGNSGEGETHSGGSSSSGGGSEGLSGGERNDDVSKSASALLGEGEEHKLQLQFEARSERKLKEWGEALNACCAWDHGVVSIVPLLKALDNATAFRDQTSVHHLGLAHGKASTASSSGAGGGAHSHAAASLGHPAFVGAGLPQAPPPYRSASASRAGSQSRSEGGGALSSEAAKTGAPFSSKKNPFAKNPFAPPTTAATATEGAAEASIATDEANSSAIAADEPTTSADNRDAVTPAEEPQSTVEAPSNVGDQAGENDLKEADSSADGSAAEEEISRDEESDTVGAADVHASDENDVTTAGPTGGSIDDAKSAGVNAGVGDDADVDDLASPESGAEEIGAGVGQEAGNESNNSSEDQGMREEGNVNNDMVDEENVVDDQSPTGSSSSNSGGDEATHDGEKASASDHEDEDEDEVAPDVMKASTLARLAAEKDAKHSAEIQHDAMDKAFSEAENIAAMDEERAASAAAEEGAPEAHGEEEEEEDVQELPEGPMDDASDNTGSPEVSDSATLEESGIGASAAAVVEPPVGDVPTASGIPAEDANSLNEVTAADASPGSDASNEKGDDSAADTSTPPSGEPLSGTEEDEAGESGKKDEAHAEDQEEGDVEKEAELAFTEGATDGVEAAGALLVDGTEGSAEATTKDEEEELSNGTGE